MFWKYIEKINWSKVIHHFLGMKYKALDMQVAYFGCDAFEIECGCSRHTDHAGPSIEITVLGVLFGISIYDYRHWNRAENRFYFDGEPEISWIGYKGYTEDDYWNDIKKCADEHKLDEDYLPRCEAAFVEDMLMRKYHKKLFAKWDEEDKKPFVLKHPIDWANVKYAKDEAINKKYTVRQVGKDKLEVTEFRVKHIMPVKDVVTWWNLYDKKGNLVSKASDYNTEEDDEYEI